MQQQPYYLYHNGFYFYPVPISNFYSTLNCNWQNGNQSCPLPQFSQEQDIGTVKEEKVEEGQDCVGEAGILKRDDGRKEKEEGEEVVASKRARVAKNY